MRIRSPSIYLQKYSADHPLWACVGDDLPVVLKLLVDRDRVLVNRDVARHVLACLQGLDDMPVETVNFDGQPVAL